MPRLHRGERRRQRGRLVALVAASVALAACASSSHPTDATTPTTASTCPLAPSSTSVSSANGVATIKGHANRTVGLPASIRLPAIVHAHHDGKGSFVISGVDSNGHRIAVLASALGPYDGTFPVGFVDSANDPTVSLRIVTCGPWQLDVGSAVLAPPLRHGQVGVGDAVLAYRGPAARAHLTHRGRSSLIVNVYEKGGLIPLVNTKGPFDGPISLVAGPAFIAVTTTGKWSMTIE